MKINIYNLTYPALEEYFISRGENKAKAKIVYNAVYKERVSDFSAIKNLSPRVTEMLKTDFEFGALEIIDRKTSLDESSVKFLCGLYDNKSIEMVLMRHDYGDALCVSTQVGCNMNCAFCRSGVAQPAKPAKQRNLMPYEMVLQLLSADSEIRKTGEKIARVNLMGTGEPLDNFSNVMRFVEIISHEHGLAIAPRHITISTCGLVPEIERIMAEELYTKFNLAISLHAPNDEIRTRIMPVNKTYGTGQLMKTIREYSSLKNKKTTIEYVMLDGVNDSDENALELSRLLSGINCYVNLIPYNETGLGFCRSGEARIKRFYEILLANKIRAVRRREFGGEIMAACGQLTTQFTVDN